MTVSRRGFLSLLGAAIAAPVLPAYSTDADGVVRIVGKDLVLDKTLDLRGVSNFLISDCRFSPTEALFRRGDPLLFLNKNGRGQILNCTIYRNPYDPTHPEYYNAEVSIVDGFRGLAIEFDE